MYCITSKYFSIFYVKGGYIPEIKMLIKYSLLHFIYLCEQIAINSTLVLARTCDNCNVFQCDFINKISFINNEKKEKQIYLFDTV